MSYIHLKRDELIWETRAYTYDSVDWKRFIERQVDALNSASEVQRFNAQQILDAVDGMSFEEVVADFKRWEEGEKSLLIKHKRWYDGWTTEVPLADIIRDEIRDCVYDADVIDTNCTDDFEETFDYQIDEEE